MAPQLTAYPARTWTGGAIDCAECARETASVARRAWSRTVDTLRSALRMLNEGPARDSVAAQVDALPEHRSARTEHLALTTLRNVSR